MDSFSRQTKKNEQIDKESWRQRLCWSPNKWWLTFEVFWWWEAHASMQSTHKGEHNTHEKPTKSKTSMQRTGQNCIVICFWVCFWLVAKNGSIVFVCVSVWMSRLISNVTHMSGPLCNMEPMQHSRTNKWMDKWMNMWNTGWSSKFLFVWVLCLAGCQKCLHFHPMSQITHAEHEHTQNTHTQSTKHTLKAHTKHKAHDTKQEQSDRWMVSQQAALPWWWRKSQET